MQVLAVDVGNMSVSFGLFEGRRLMKEWRLPTASLRKQILSHRLLHQTKPEKLKGIILCSVVPWATTVLKRRLLSVASLPVHVVGQTVHCPIPNRYKKPRQVGQDRLVNAYAALRLYGAPAIVCDFGTAITVDLLSKKGEYLGGIICPGIGISLQALAEKTALLPRISLSPPKQLLGRETKETIRSGAFFGFASLCDGLVERLREKYGRGVKAILTGGHSKLISTYCKSINYTNHLLTLQGLALLFQEAKRGRSSLGL
jgi:type III pantothenate kinase